MLGNAAGHDAVDPRRHHLAAIDAENRRENGDSQQEIGKRAGRHDRGAGGNPLAREGRRPFGRAHLVKRGAIAPTCLVFVAEEFDVAAERDQRQPPARPLAIVKPEDLRPESDRKHLDCHAAPAGHEEVAEFVEEHHDREDEQERHHIADRRRAKTANNNDYVTVNTYLHIVLSIVKIVKIDKNTVI